MNKLSIPLIPFILLIAFRSVFGRDFIHPQKSDYPQFPARGEGVNDFVPNEWSIVGHAKGDLNRDKTEDHVLVIKANDNRFLNKNEGLGTNVFDTNPRVLAILFKDGTGYRLAKQSDTFIIPPDSPTMDEPFQDVTIKNGVLQLDFHLWYSAGTWYTTNYSYKFKFLDGEFVLIGADRTESMRNTGRMESQSYNFLTNKVRMATGNFTEEK